MASERQLQDLGNSTQEDSLGIQDAQQIADPVIMPTSPINSDSKDNNERSQQVDLLTKKLQDNLNSIDTDTI
jgi:hypothetical protein